MESVHQFVVLLHKANVKINESLAILEPLYSVWSGRSTLFEKLDALQPHKPNIPKVVTKVFEKIGLVITISKFFKGKSNQVKAKLAMFDKAYSK